MDSLRGLRLLRGIRPLYGFYAWCWTIVRAVIAVAVTLGALVGLLFAWVIAFSLVVSVVVVLVKWCLGL